MTGGRRSVVQALESLGLSHAWAVTLVALIAAGILVTFVALSALFFIWLERKVSGRIQDRLGPTRVGGKFGWLQTVADGVKLICKEDTIPANADHFLFRIAPYIAFSGAFVAFVALPFGNGVVAAEMNVAAFFILAILSTEVFGIILAGYGSGSKWSLFGGIREAAQVVSYEVPRAMTVLLPVILAGTLNLNTIANQQSGFLWNWFIFHDPFTFVAFWVFFTCATASCKRAPFDLAEAESELVAGFHTEYSGLRWSLFFMAEYGAMFAASGIATILFLGGWNTGLLPGDPAVLLGADSTWLWIVGNILNVCVFIAKGWLLVFVMMWVRWTLPRLRIDQVMMTCLKYLLPISCVLLLGLCLWQLMMPTTIATIVRYLLTAASVAVAVITMIKLLTQTPTTGIPPSMMQSFGPASAPR
jgi:NADH-quinone oxidoreductase subunit H